MTDSFVVHNDTVVEQLMDQGSQADIHEQVMELPGPVPLWCVRSRHPDGATRSPVVLIHGFAQNRFSWSTSTRSMSAWLANQGWDVWNLELRGHGRSRREGNTRAECFDDYPTDLLRLSNALPEPAFWLGHSLGATVAYAAAAATPEATPTRGIVGIGGLYRFGRCGFLIPAACQLTHRLPKFRWFGKIQVDTMITAKLLSRMFPMMDVAGYGLPISGWWPGSVEKELAAERMLRGFDFIPVRIWEEMADWGATDTQPWDAGWRSATAPCLIIVGDKDSMLFPEEGRAAWDRSGSADRTYRLFDLDDGDTHWGHLDMILGRHAREHVWPVVHDWMAER